MPQLSDDRQRTKVYHNDRYELPDCTSWVASHGELTPDTEPEAVAETHRIEVAAAVDALRSLSRPVSIATLSYLTCLPEWNVRRACESLGITDVTESPVAVATQLTDAEILKLLLKIIRHHSMTASAISIRANLPLVKVRRFMKDRPEHFRIDRPAGRRTSAVWKLVKPPSDPLKLKRGSIVPKRKKNRAVTAAA